MAIIKIPGRRQEQEVSVTNQEELPSSLEAPVSGTVYGTLLNYKGEFEALGAAMHEAPYNSPPKAPILYIKPANTVIGHGMGIPVPCGTKHLQMGAALGVVIGKTATRVRADEAFSYISGYTIVNDVSIPHESVYRPAIKQKARDGFCPIGPWVVEKKQIGNPDSLSIRVFINKEIRQENTTSNLIRSVAKLLEEVTDFMTLWAGDVLLAGVPEDAPLATIGDHVRIEIEGVGFLENTLISENAWEGGAKS